MLSTATAKGRSSWRLFSAVTAAVARARPRRPGLLPAGGATPGREGPRRAAPNTHADSGGPAIEPRPGRAPQSRRRSAEVAEQGQACGLVIEPGPQQLFPGPRAGEFRLEQRLG